MSYILDALRRAENERARGQVPGLEAQALSLTGDDEGQRRGPGLPWIGAGLLLGAAIAAGLWWWLRAPSEGQRAPMSVAQAPTTPSSAPMRSAAAPAPAVAPPAPAVAASVAPRPRLPAPPPARAVAPAPAPTAAAPAPAPRSAPARTPDPAPAAPVRSPQGAGAPAPAAATDAARPARAGASATAPAPDTARPSRTAASAAGAAPSPAGDTRPVPLAELTAQQRSALPSMAIGGAIYSESAASRFVLINGQVVREGETAAPGVTLERIAPRSVVLRWRELRIEVPL